MEKQARRKTKDETTPTRLHEPASEINLKKVREMMAAHARDLHREIEVLREKLAEKDKDFELFRDSVVKPVLKHVYSDEERNRLLEIEQEYLMMWASLEELNLVAPLRQNMAEHGFEF